MASPVTKAPPVKYTALEGMFADVFDNPVSTLKDFPILKWGAGKLFRIPLKKSDPDLLESINLLGGHIASVGFALSLCSWSFVPAACCGTLIMIFKKTFKELREKKKVTEQLQEISSKVDNLFSTVVLTSNANTKELSSKLDEITTMILASKINVETMQKTSKDIQKTTEDLQGLKKEEQALLKEYQAIQKKYNVIAEFLGKKCKTLSDETQKLTGVRKKLSKEVDRLSAVPKRKKA